jgi:TolB protein
MFGPSFRDFFLGLALLTTAAAASAQDGPATNAVIAVPPLATPNNVKTDVGQTAGIGNGIAKIISADLDSTNNVRISDLAGIRIPSYPEVTAPAYPQWQASGAKLLVSGFVEARSGGRLMVGCYVYDVQQERELARQGFLVATADWRRAAHKCADTAYGTLTGSGPLFDSRIAYVAESGSQTEPVKRIAVMDIDGTNHAFVTAGTSTAIDPRWSPGATRLAYTSFNGLEPHIQIVDLGTNEDRPLLPGGTSFAPAFAPDGAHLALSIGSADNVDIYSVGADGTGLTRLTTSPAIDTDPCYSPDGQHIVFASDRSGTQQLYVMDADGSGQRRISFRSGGYGSPSWSPDGKHIAFTKVDGAVMRIGVMKADGSGEHILTNGITDESPNWGPSGDQIIFDRWLPGGRGSIYTVSVAGGKTRPISTPQPGSDPAWAARER